MLGLNKNAFGEKLLNFLIYNNRFFAIKFYSTLDLSLLLINFMCQCATRSTTSRSSVAFCHTKLPALNYEFFILNFSRGDIRPYLLCLSPRLFLLSMGGWAVSSLNVCWQKLIVKVYFCYTLLCPALYFVSFLPTYLLRLELFGKFDIIAKQEICESDSWRTKVTVSSFKSCFILSRLHIFISQLAAPNNAMASLPAFNRSSTFNESLGIFSLAWSNAWMILTLGATPFTICAWTFCNFRPKNEFRVLADPT